MTDLTIINDIQFRRKDKEIEFVYCGNNLRGVIRDWSPHINLGNRETPIQLLMTGDDESSYYSTWEAAREAAKARMKQEEE